ncbi:hypothetical protein GUI37_04590 [Helcococcus kunzii]|uniref:thermonuclease family protein n=1 Tax=Helcococcus kunzii TaxID=40091 RepID=UPI001BAFBB2E|nr:thermonuclease family protein [Helcococcus kunzii]QUY64828.1 hypothetical protein GUI37_04590 [Helcococcus kunzii]
MNIREFIKELIRKIKKKHLNITSILFGLYILSCLVSLISLSNFRSRLFLGSVFSVPLILALALKNKKVKILKTLYASAAVFIFSIVFFQSSNEEISKNNLIKNVGVDDKDYDNVSFARISSDSKIEKPEEESLTVKETIKETTQESIEETFKETLKEQPIQDNNTKLAESSKKESSQIKSVIQTLDENKKKENNIKYYEIEKIVDGDTIRIYKDGKVEKIRLLLVDTPESVHSQQYKNVKLGTSAYIFTRDFLQGHKVSLEYDEEKIDRYGRTLAYVYRDDGKSLNKALLQASLAKVVLYEPNDKYYNEYKAIERQVRPKGNGIWANIEAAFPGKPKEVKIKEQKKKVVQNKKVETKQKTENIEHKKQTVDTSSQKALIKGNINRKGEKIYHLPGMRDYDKTKINTSKGERWFRTEQEAINAGWRRAKR